MGFKKKKFTTTIHIPMSFLHQFLNDAGDVVEEESVEVTHIFRTPTSKHMERYRREVVKVKGTRMQHGGTKALWNLFCGTIIRVEGYDDLSAEDQQDRGNIVQYFNDDLVRHHAENGVELLLERLQSDEAGFEKKFGPSSGA